MTTNMYNTRNVAVTATKKSQARMAAAWFFKKVDQRWSPRGCPRGRFGMYLRTVRGETRIPSLSSSSLAIRSSPHRRFSIAILRISARNSFGMGGRPGRHFNRQNNRQPARCQRIIVAGCTTTSALRQSNSLARTAKLTRRSIYWSRLDAALDVQRQLTAQEEVLGLDRFGRTEQQHHPAQGVFDQAQCNPREGDHAAHRATAFGP